ncbi:MAG TPA: hypothetical protein H9815_04145 [Candidatus Ruania gallistercoris]|uniref:Permease n=1 Tax=Candidatus Ruania gallistercoris TaxID=2838746 RepID=A0A9D2ED35_9MICO|nr:hypothetical protein [Candidatus Ruania gallistercoris]
MSTADPQHPRNAGTPDPTETPAGPQAPGSEQPARPQAPGSEQGAPSRWKFADGVPPVWLRRITIGAGIVIVLVLLGVLGSIVLPGWWAGMVTGWVQGVSSAGILTGLVCGFVFTVIPVSVIWLAVTSSWEWRTRLIVAAAVAVVALPNVLTLVIDVGTTSSAVDARLDMVIGAPAFTGSTLAGVLIALVGVVGGVLGWRWLRRSRAELREARARAPKKSRGAAAKKPRGGAGSRRSESETTAFGEQDSKGRGVQ